MINVIGLGYIGLPTALMLAKSGQEVIGTDYNSDLVNKLNSGELTFEEKGLKQLFAEANNNGISFTTSYQRTNFYILAVPTPYLNHSKKLDPTYVIKALEKVLEVCEFGTIIVVESTISPGSIDRYVRPEIEKRGYIIGQDIHLVHAPERIIPGNMIYELEFNSRTIGADSHEIANRVKEV